MPDRVIAELRGRQGRDGLVRLPPPPPALMKGNSLRIIGGALAGCYGLYAGQAPHDRIMVLVSLLGSQRAIELPAGDVVPVPG